MSSRELNYYSKGRAYLEGSLIVQKQPEGFHIYTEPRTYIEAHQLSALKFWLEQYNPRIGAGGEIRLLIPKGQKYGTVITQIARAYHLIQRKGIYPTIPVQSQLHSEVS